MTLGDSGMFKLCQAFNEIKAITRLNLSHNEMTNFGVEFLVKYGLNQKKDNHPINKKDHDDYD